MNGTDIFRRFASFSATRGMKWMLGKIKEAAFFYLFHFFLCACSRYRGEGREKGDGLFKKEKIKIPSFCPLDIDMKNCLVECGMLSTKIEHLTSFLFASLFQYLKRIK